MFNILYVLSFNKISQILINESVSVALAIVIKVISTLSQSTHEMIASCSTGSANTNNYFVFQKEVEEFQKKRRESGQHSLGSSLEGSSSLHLACKAGRVAEAEALLAAGADINKLDKALYTPFMDAIDSGKPTVLQ